MTEPQIGQQLSLFDLTPPTPVVDPPCTAKAVDAASARPDAGDDPEPQAVNDPNFFGGDDLDASLDHYRATGDDIYVLEWLSDNDEVYARLEDECAEHDTREYPTAQDKRIVATLLDELDAYRLQFINQHLYGNASAEPESPGS